MTENLKWYFTAETNAKGYTYIKTYQTQWDPIKKRPHSLNRRHVGRLFDDGRVVPSAKFLADFPQYANYPLYFGAEKKLVDELTYKREFPERPGPKPDPETVRRDDILDIGVSWAVETLAEQSGLYGSLVEIFGKEAARALLHLAIFILDDRKCMAAYQYWWQRVYLKQTKPMSDQRISELLATVTVQKFEAFFALRHKAKIEKTKEEPLTYALDNTSISTYSRTISDAAYGYAKRDPDLKQINYTFVCDQKDGEIVFAYTYDGSINDTTALSEIIYRMRANGMDFSKVILVTDRGYSSLMNIQKFINLELKFIQGVRLTEDSIKAKFDLFRDSLRDVAFYDADTGTYARTVKEPWAQATDAGRLNHDTFVHLYRFPGSDEDEMTILASKVNEILKCKQQGKTVAPDLWRTHGSFVVELKDKEDKPYWARNDDAIREAIRYAGLFVIRTNVLKNPFDALKVYRLRGMVETDFNQYKNWVDGDRLRCTTTSYLGKLFVCTLSASLRLMMLKRSHANAKKLNIKVPDDSVDVLMEALGKIRAEKRANANAWVVRQIAKKQREMLALLGLPLPPKTLR